MTHAYRHREESLNTQLAILLSRHGISAESEAILRSGVHRPDVLFVLDGLRVVVEGKFADTPDAEGVVLADAEGRLQSGVARIAVALIYPLTLRTTPTAQMEARLAEEPLRFAVLSELGITAWSEADPAEILAALRRVQEVMAQEDVVAKAAENLSLRIEDIAALWAGQGATCDRLSVLLGMPAPRQEPNKDREARRGSAARIAALVLANAMLFQAQLALSGNDARIRPLSSYAHDPDPVSALREHWRWIWQEINYVPIFQLGESVLLELPISPATIAPVRWLLKEAVTIGANQSALRHDLMGRIYHWLLHQAKYLGTYYTSTAAATLLLQLTLARPWEGMDFGSARKLKDFTAADLACGTGTLLMATAQALTDRFILARAQTGRSLAPTDLKQLHETLMENVLHGYDVLPSAVHLTASTLGMLAPQVTFRSMNLYVVPMGVEGAAKRLGSLDFLAHHRIATQFMLDQSQAEVTRRSVSGEAYAVAEVPRLDLCVMNPPFVRSVGGNLLFGSLPADERGQLQSEFKKRVKGAPASITAGMGSVFMAIADKHLAVGGRMAFILPVALATGEAWGVSRQLIAEGYHLETLIVSHDADRPNFSENTDLSELMFIARKLKKNETPGETLCIALWHNPHTILEAMNLALRLDKTPACALAEAGVSGTATLARRKQAEFVRIPPPEGEAQWPGVQFAQTQLLRAALALAQGKVAVPGQDAAGIRLCPLGELGALGPDRKRIHEGFQPSIHDWSPYSGFWNHDSQTVTTITQKPNAWLSPWQESPRGPDYGRKRLWPRAGRILLVERLWPITHRVMAIGFDEAVLGNTWWALQADLSPPQEKALLLWLNGSAALLLLLLRRVTTRQAWMQVKQPQWAAMPVLDVRALATEPLETLAAAYDALSTQPLLALAKLDRDPVRKQIDAALSAALALPDLAPLRALMAREPGLTGKAIAPEPGQVELFASHRKPQHPPAPEQLKLI